MNVAQFIHSHIETVDQLRVVLLLRNEPKAEWNLAGLSTKLYLPRSLVAAALARLEEVGLVGSRGDPPVYFYRPQTSDLAALMDEVVALDREKPVTLLNMIYARPRDIQAFADAFKLRKEE